MSLAKHLATSVAALLCGLAVGAAELETGSLIRKKFVEEHQRITSAPARFSVLWERNLQQSRMSEYMEQLRRDGMVSNYLVLSRANTLSSNGETVQFGELVIHYQERNGEAYKTLVLPLR